MDKFTVHIGLAAPLLRDNIDTDAIIPSREMKTVSKLGLADGLFSAWRYRDEANRTPNPEFVLNKPEFKGASILLAGNNFGCGSSREHAAWALKEFGIHCIIAEGFGSIFHSNCVRNGILPIQLGREKISHIADKVTCAPPINKVKIDLKNLNISIADKLTTSFSVAATDREMLLEGLDPIAATQKLQSLIDNFAERDRLARPWL